MPLTDRIFIDHRVLLVEAVTQWLASHLRVTQAGVQSLRHLLVIVPTRQAGRRLRFALAEHIGACLPPLIRLPAQMILPVKEPLYPIATPTETLGLLSHLLLKSDLSAFPNLFPIKGRPPTQSFSWALNIARQLVDLWNILEENTLTMQDVAIQIDTLLKGEDLDIEVARWQDLATLETRFFNLLREKNYTPKPLARKAAIADPYIPEGIERIILPALIDAQPAFFTVLEKLKSHTSISVLIHADPTLTSRFDTWGRPNSAQWLADQNLALPLTDEDITLTANSAEQARVVANLFASIPKNMALPSLGMADTTLFTELQAAFLTQDITLHDPSSYLLSCSSLGRLIQQLEQLCHEPRFPVLAAFLREADVMHWLNTQLSAHAGFSYATILQTLDELQNKHLPQTLDAVLHICRQAPSDMQPVQVLAAVLDAIKALLEPNGLDHVQHITAILRTLFMARALKVGLPGDRELAAAAQTTLAILKELSSNLLSHVLDEPQRALLFETLLADARYQLEPEDAEALLTEGWLELPWSPSQELVITGFNEGSIPESVIGHAFLPDRLRQALGLPNNDQRAARDIALLHALLASRQPHAVHLTLERINSRNDVRKPSRLLFLCDETTLTQRVNKLYRDAENAASGHHRSLPEAWRLALPIPALPPARLRVTDFKAYLECPFTFYLSRILKMEAQDDRMVELDALAFGSLCHQVLETFGRSDLKHEASAKKIAAFLEAEVWQQIHSQYGKTLPSVIHLQALAACERLKFFAIKQAQLRADGWGIHTIEYPLTLTEHDLDIRGRVDRIDYHEASGTWRLIDYKTGNFFGKSSDDELKQFMSASKSALALASQRGDKPFIFNAKPRIWTDLQLPLYLLMAQASGLIPANAPVECGYFVLGETEQQTVCKTWNVSAGLDSALTTLRWVIASVKAGIYWPPSTRDVWKRDFSSLFLDTPEQSICKAWLDDQQTRLSRESATCHV